MDYGTFLDSKSQLANNGGFAPTFLPDCLFDFQKALTEWALRCGRAAVFADCGMGKTLIGLVFSENVVRKTNGRVLILTPLAVAAQTISEGEKFGIAATRSPMVNGSGIYVTNYERLHHYQASDFDGVVCDESSILKNFDGATKAAVTEFMRRVPYRLLCTATAAPNDYVELGTSSEALGYLGHMDMLNRFFKNNRNTSDTKGHWRGHGAPRMFEGQQWCFKGHSETAFWKWVCSWARALRKPSDLDFSDKGFDLPPLVHQEQIVGARRPRDGWLFSVEARGLREQREERRRTIQERSEKAAELVNGTKRPAVCWAHLNDEADLMERLIPDSVQVSGSDSDESKEEKFYAFSSGQARVLVVKPVIGAWGLNWQHCAHMTVFAGYSFEQYYQGIRRCWRFGQTRPVVVENIVSDGETDVQASRKRKAEQAEKMFEELVRHMREGTGIARTPYGNNQEEIPSWLCLTK